MYSKTVYQYDAHGNKTEERNYNSDGKLSSTTIYTYDKNGNNIEKSWKGRYSASKYVRQYDANGNWVKEITYQPRVSNITERTIEYYD